MTIGTFGKAAAGTGVLLLLTACQTGPVATTVEYASPVYASPVYAAPVRRVEYYPAYERPVVRRVYRVEGGYRDRPRYRPDGYDRPYRPRRVYGY